MGLYIRATVSFQDPKAYEMKGCGFASVCFCMCMCVFARYDVAFLNLILSCSYHYYTWVTHNCVPVDFDAVSGNGKYSSYYFKRQQS